MKKIAAILFLIMMAVSFSCKKDENGTGSFKLVSVTAGSQSLSWTDLANLNVAIDQPIVANFSEQIDVTTAQNSFLLISEDNDTLPLTLSFLNESKTVSANPTSDLDYQKSYHFIITDKLKSLNGESFIGVTISFVTEFLPLKIDSLTVAEKNFLVGGYITNVNRNFPARIIFNQPVDPATISPSSVQVLTKGIPAPVSISLEDSNKLLITATSPLIHFDKYTFVISSNVKSSKGVSFNGYSRDFYTAIDSTPKFPLLSDDDLLTTVQQQTFKYFWDFAHPVSGMARERNTSGDVVTTGGSGFGVMAIIIGIQRNFITRAEGLGRLNEILSFLETCDRFHGAFPHWMNGNTGDVVPFGVYDNGADIVETSYMMEGLLCMRQYLDPYDSYESTLISRINALWDGVEWNWFTKDGQENVLYWNWSPNNGWAVNVPVVGWNEALITYFLAAASNTHSISADVYTQGWAGGSQFMNGNTYYGYTLPLGPAYGGPLFFAHYSFIGLNPTNLSDQYANYWTQNTNHSLINYNWCLDDPNNFVGYGSECWGLTASDDQNGYAAHSPTYDIGVITPTAAISSLSYSPTQSMKALKFFYYTIGDKTWGDYGFYDAFNVTEGWWGNSYLAIDEGPIIDMIENYRTGLLWNLFMSCPEVHTAMTKLGFTN